MPRLPPAPLKSAKLLPIPRSSKPVESEDHLQRVWRICNSLPDVSGKLSHGEPTFLTAKRVFAMFSNKYHNAGRVVVWLPATSAEQASLIDIAPAKYYRLPYVGVSG